MPERVLARARPRPPLPRDDSAASRQQCARDHAAMTALLRASAVRGFARTYELGMHYLDASGTPVNIPMSVLLDAMPTLHQRLQASLRAQVAALPGGGAFDTGWSVFAAPAGTDWAYALGRFSIRLRGTVDVVDGVAQVRYRSSFADVYDFTAGQPFGQFQALADNGWAAEFLVSGATQAVTDMMSLSKEARMRVDVPRTPEL